jgi:cytochrome c-type protein NapB
MVALALGGLSLSPGASGDEEEKKGKSGDEMGLSHESVFDTEAPPPSPHNDASPGDGAPLPRPYPDAPPVIPHGVDDFLPITREENMCLMCHGDPDMGAPVMPPSHYLDLRNAPTEPREEIAGSRYPCLLCHVVWSDVPPLVGNDFSAVDDGEDAGESP